MVYKHLFIHDSPVARVTFTLPNSLWVDTIHLVGDFNHWNNGSHPLHRNRTGQWTITIDLERDQAYRFRYLCDSQEWRTEFPAEAYRSGPDQIEAFVVNTLQ